jgi:pyruvate,water dikinase
MIREFGWSEGFTRSKVGGKAYALNKLHHEGICVPYGFVVFADDFFSCLHENCIYDDIASACVSTINIENVAGLSRELTEMVQSCNLSSSFAEELNMFLTDKINNYASVRSSSVSEDGDNHTFAGIHDSFLNVHQDTLCIIDAIKKCWASLFTERSLMYRIRQNLPLFEGMAVIVQNMIQAKTSGVVYTKHPVDNKFILIEASFGIGDSVVDGSVRPDQILIDRETREVVSEEIGTKKSYTGLLNGIHSKQIKTSDNESISIDYNIIQDLIAISIKIEKIFGISQDIEWAYDDQLWILQSRTVNF